MHTVYVCIYVCVCILSAYMYCVHVYLLFCFYYGKKNMYICCVCIASFLDMDTSRLLCTDTDDHNLELTSVESSMD